MAVNFQPKLVEDGATAYDNLLYGPGPFDGLDITIPQDAARTTRLARGTLLVDQGAGNAAPLPGEAVTVAISATGEVIFDNLAITDLVIPFQLAFAPIPGTVHLVTTATGVITTLFDLGTDNGQGYGAGADGHFTIDYQTGQGVATLDAAPTATNDLKAGYQHQSVAAGVGGALPRLILAEDIEAASLVAGAVVTWAYSRGTFNRNKVIGYQPGHEFFLNQMGIWTKVALAA